MLIDSLSEILMILPCPARLAIEADTPQAFGV